MTPYSRLIKVSVSKVTKYNESYVHLVGRVSWSLSLKVQHKHVNSQYFRFKFLWSCTTVQIQRQKLLFLLNHALHYSFGLPTFFSVSKNGGTMLISVIEIFSFTCKWKVWKLEKDHFLSWTHILSIIYRNTFTYSNHILYHKLYL